MNNQELIELKIVGQYDTSGNYHPYTEPTEVVQLGNTLRDKFYGTIDAVLDEYGDWVSPSMKALGLKSKIKVEIARKALEQTK